MKVFILAGGLGTRLSEETILRPKPMVEVGGHPILWHIMKIYSHYGFNDFVLLCGYKIEVIKYYFLNYYANNSDFTINLKTDEIKIHSTEAEPWKVTILNTGLNTSTGSRIQRAKDFILDSKDPFMLTYGDGVANINIPELLAFHKKNKKIATMTTVLPMGRFGSVNIDNNGVVDSFVEKPQGAAGWINAGFFVFEPEFLNYIPDFDVMLEQDPLISLVKDKQLSAYKHEGFWKAMDTLRDNQELNKLWNAGKSPWKIWE